MNTIVFTIQEPEINKLPEGRFANNHTRTPPKQKQMFQVFTKDLITAGKNLFPNIMDTNHLLRFQQQSALRMQIQRGLLSRKIFP